MVQPDRMADDFGGKAVAVVGIGREFHDGSLAGLERSCQIGYRDNAPDGPVEKNPRYLDALAQRDEAARQLAHTVVRASFAGIVTNVPSIAPGKYLPASTTAFFLVAADHVWVNADPKETELTYVHPGQPVTVTIDTYPDAEWDGTVASISPAASQEFAFVALLLMPRKPAEWYPNCRKR
jgi:hypothetical protein